jgi:hypothetical protein
MVLPDGPAAHGAATSWRVDLLLIDSAALALPLVGIKSTSIDWKTGLLDYGGISYGEMLVERGDSTIDLLRVTIKGGAITKCDTHA